MGGMGAGGMGGHQPPRPNYEHLKESDPEMYEVYKQDDELERETFRLADAYRKSGGKEENREKVRKQLKEVVEKHFKIRQQRREYELKRLEDQLDRLRKSVKMHQEKSDAVIERRLSALLGEDGLEF